MVAANAPAHEGPALAHLHEAMRASQEAARCVLSGQSGRSKKIQTASGKYELARLRMRFALPWSDYVLLLGARSPEARAFYEAEALRGGWTVPQPSDAVTPEEELKDPLVLILCATKDAAVAKYALEGLPSKVPAAEYRTTLPDEKVLMRSVIDERRALEERTQRRSGSRR